MKKPKPTTANLPRTGAVGLAIVIIIIAAAALWWHHRHKPLPQILPAPAHTATPPSTQTAPPPTAGGQPIPEQFWTKARRLGYYCPSWNAKPGQMAPDICTQLDK